MEPTDAAISLYREIAETLDNPSLEPDPARRWDGARERLDDLWRRVEHELIPGARAAYREPATAAIPPGDLAGLLLELAAVYAAAAMRDRAEAAREHAASMVPADHPVRELIEGAKADPDAAYAIVLAQWKARHRDVDGHDAVLRRAQRAARDPRMKAAIARLLDGPRPVKSAPTLATLNGVGAMLYGRRDARPDGSYVATRFFTFFFVPLLPLDAWRVRPGEGSSYYFLAKEPLSGLVRNYRRLVAGAAVALALTVPFNTWYNSPSRHAARALGEAQAFARTHPPEAALARYRALAQTYAFTAPAEAERAAAEVVRLVTARVERPATLAQQPRVLEAIRAFDELPEGAKGSGPRRALAASLQRWESELGDASLAALELRGTLLHTLRRVNPGADEARWREAEERLEGDIARRAGADWPVDALAHALRAGRGFDEAATWPWVEAILRSSSSVRYARDELVGWSSRAHEVDRRARVEAALARADERAADAARAAALRDGQREALAAARARDPGDQEVALALASLDFSAGDDAARRRCLADLEALGPFGAAPPEVQSARAAMMFALGRGAEADRLVEGLSDLRLPTMRRLTAEARARRSSEIERYVADARAGRLPPDLRGRLERASNSEQQEMFRAWVVERLGQDATLRELEARAERYAPLVGAVLTRGRWLLREANDRSGRARQELLERARGVFLSVSTESEGSAEYRLAMGQVEHQLGRAAEGEALLQPVLRSGSVAERLAVAGVYRNLGLLARAREVADRAWQDATDDNEKKRIATFRITFPASLEDEELWLPRADDGSAQFAIHRKSTEAHRAQREGRYADADRLLLEARALYTPAMLLTGAGANNAAILDQERFSCTGDVARLEEARAGLETALRREPESATVVHNLTGQLTTLAAARAVDPALRLRALRPRTADLFRLAHALRGGAGGADVAAALTSSAPLRRAGELVQQLETLSPSASYTWSASWGLARLADDPAALDAVAARLARAPRIESDDTDRERERAERPEVRAEARQSAAAQLREVERAVTAAEATGHAPTRAAAYAMRAWRREEAVAAAEDLAQVDAIVTDLRAAMAVTPAPLELRADLADSLFLAALAHTLGGADAARRASYFRDVRAHGFTLALARLAQADRGVRDAVRASPEAAEALTLLAAVEPHRVGIDLRALVEALGAPPLATTPAATHWLLTHDAIDRRIDANSPSHPLRDAALARLRGG